MNVKEDAFTYSCDGDNLIAIIHKSKSLYKKGVLILVGGPQYRVGSHRQFLLLARMLAKSGINVMRYDYRGMGDSEGERRSFDSIETDIRVAIDEFFKRAENIEEVVIWGLCDAASASVMYAYKDKRVTGLVLLNPWVRTEHSMAKTYIKQYYFNRLFSLDFWNKIIKGQYKIKESLNSFTKLVFETIGIYNKSTLNKNALYDKEIIQHEIPLPKKIEQGLKNYQGQTLIILSGKDFTAAEFKDLIKSSASWRTIISRNTVITKEIPDANHTFSRAIWRDQVAQWTRDWIMSW